MIDSRFIASQTQTCYGCPDQWEGELVDGRSFYFRYRHGWASLGIGSSVDAAIADRGEVGVSHGDGLQGMFHSDEERSQVFAALLAERHGPLHGKVPDRDL